MTSKERDLFEGPIGKYHRGWFGFLFKVSLSEAGEKKCQALFEQFPKIKREIIVELLKNLCGAGFMAGADSSPVPYDGSRIDHVTKKKIKSTDGWLQLTNLTVFQSGDLELLEDDRLALESFFTQNKALLEEFSNFDGSFRGSHPFGIFHCENLFGRKTFSEEQFVLSDFTVLRTKNQVSLKEGLLAVEDFLRDNQELLEELSDFTGSFWETYPFGVFRCESLLSMTGIEKQTIYDYLDQLMLNLRERKRLFGKQFAEIHRSSGIPFDHDPKRNILKPQGFSRKLGTITVDGKEKEVFLRFGVGYGEGHMGMSLTICLNTPRSDFFKVFYQLVRGEGNQIVPQIVTAQASPLQIDKSLNFVAEFLPHQQFPGKETVFAVKNAVTKLLGGGDIFDTLIAALISYYRAEGYQQFSGIKGEDNRWLRFHADEVLENQPGAEKVVAARARQIYCERFARLGFSRVNGWWLVRNLFAVIKRALSPQTVGNRKKKVFCRADGKETLKRVKLPRLEAAVNERGLAMVGESLNELLPVSAPQVEKEEFSFWLELIWELRPALQLLCA